MTLPIVATAFDLVPAAIRRPITLRTKDGTETTVEALPGAPKRRFGPGATTSQAERVYALVGATLPFAPTEGMLVIDGDREWRILSVSTVEDGVSGLVAQYRLAVAR